ncbi:hypothetical protein Scep_012289 [Stephania cephalantha]|uniref:Uncharacterized protein n=1 Tax=Stephania cephalantha TaxID=152367 RepID=A0AAP0P9Q2_9MAGN
MWLESRYMNPIHGMKIDEYDGLQMSLRHGRRCPRDQLLRWYRPPKCNFALSVLVGGRRRLFSGHQMMSELNQNLQNVLLDHSKADSTILEVDAKYLLAIALVLAFARRRICTQSPNKYSDESGE